ncbi:MAG: hypothetical protein ABIL14_02230 [candidate division WOR-3 bacterium]
MKYLKFLPLTFLIVIFFYDSCKSNKPPEIPQIIGIDSGAIGNYTFSSFAKDPDGDSVTIKFDWGDGDTSEWSQFVESGDTISMSHFYDSLGNYEIRAKAKDIHNSESDWSAPHTLLIGSGLLWSKSIGGAGADYSYSIQFGVDNGYIIVGATNSTGAGGFDVYLIKVDTTGNLLWEKTFGGNGDDYGYAIKSYQGNYIIVGNTNSFGAGNSDVYLLKTDAQGNLLWQKTFGGSANDYGNDLAITTDGFIITGSTGSYGAGSGDVWLIKTDFNGDTLWTRTYGGGGLDGGNSVQVCNDNGFIIAGYTYSAGSSGDVYLIKTNASGDTLWTRTYGTSLSDCGNMVKQTTDNGYIIVGGNGNIYLIETDNSGNLIWEKTYGSTYTDNGYSVEESPDGRFVVVGYITDIGNDIDIYYLETDGSGNKIKEYNLGDWQYNYGRSSLLNSMGDCIICGYTKTNLYSYDVYLVCVGR